MSGFHYKAGDHAPHGVAIERVGDGWRVVIDGRAHDIAVKPHAGGRLELTIGGVRRSAYVAAVGTRRWVAIGDRTWQLERIDGSPRRRAGSASESGHDVLEATMPGQVRAVLVDPGATVKAGQTLVLLEAMKMELQVKAPHDGTVAAVLVQVGQVVERGQRLVDIDATAAAG